MSSQTPGQGSSGANAKDLRFTPAAVTLPKGGGGIHACARARVRLRRRKRFHGFGWSVAYPAISRRTDRGLPRSLDVQESDTFLISGAEDLVPVGKPDGARFVEDRNGYRITRYRPRTEGLFARIERWTKIDDPTDTFWRSISRDNIITIYGKTAASRITDPAVQPGSSAGCSQNPSTIEETQQSTSTLRKTIATSISAWRANQTAPLPVERPTAI